MENENEIDEELEKVLDEQFPKGDNARGKALVLFAIANLKINKLKKNKRKVYRIYDEDFSWYGDEDDIMYWLLDSQIEYIRETLEEELDRENIDDDEVEKLLKEKGWVWGLELAGTNFEAI